MSNTEDPYPGSTIDLKCKEKVTDSDSENGSGDEGERKVVSFTLAFHTRDKYCKYSTYLKGKIYGLYVIVCLIFVNEYIQSGGWKSPTSYCNFVH